MQITHLIIKRMLQILLRKKQTDSSQKGTCGKPGLHSIGRHLPVLVKGNSYQGH